MSITAKDKKQICDIWLESFPTLYPYRNDKLYKVLGAFIMGIELIKLPRIDEYRPHFVLYSLYGNSFKVCMDYPVFLSEFYDKKNLQYSIKYKNDLPLTIDAISRVKKQLPFDINKDVRIKLFYKLLDSKIKDRLIIKQLKQPDYFEVKFYLALYKSIEEADKVLIEIQKNSKSWDMHKFEIYYGEFEIWINNLKKIQRDELHSIIEKNKSNPKISKLEEFKFI